MRVRRWIIATTCTLLAVATAGACGGSSTSGVSADSGIDSTVDTGVVAKDTGSDTAPADTGTTCDLDADLTAQIPDAAIGDAGETTGLCLACVNTPATCGQYIDQCNADCDCKNAIPGILTCLAGGGGQGCFFTALSLPTAAQKIGENLLGCVEADCETQCIPTGLLDGGVDAD